MINYLVAQTCYGACLFVFRHEFVVAGFLNYYDACSEGLKAASPLLMFGGPGDGCDSAIVRNFFRTSGTFHSIQCRRQL